MKRITLLSLCLVSQFGLAADAEQNWLDKQHSAFKNRLARWSHNIDSWIGTPDPNKPASANLRLMLDNEWNRYDGYSIKPRVRGKIKLPALKQHLSVVFGDDNLDNQARDKQQLHRNYRHLIKDDKTYDKRQVRNDNASLALRWSNGIKGLGIKTDFDLGVRSGADVFLRARASKMWQYNDTYSTRLEQIYRYGINSKHYLRTNLENKRAETENRFLISHTFLQYSHDLDEETIWGNSFYRQHNFTGYKQLNYGILFSGKLKDKKLLLNTYGPFVNWRQPILRKWLFIQTEVHLYNSREDERKHHMGTFLRLEAIF